MKTLVQEPILDSQQHNVRFSSLPPSVMQYSPNTTAENALLWYNEHEISDFKEDIHSSSSEEEDFSFV